MDFAGLKTAVQSTFSGRTDIPDHIYEVTLAELNRDARTMDMQATSTLSASAESVSLPSDFLEAITAHIDDGTSRVQLRPFTPDALNVNRYGTGRPDEYAIVDGAMLLKPTPDGSYDVELRYFQRLSTLSADADQNAVLEIYPEVYLYCALKHTAMWAGDPDRVMQFEASYRSAFSRMTVSERRRANSGPIKQKIVRDMSCQT